MKIMKRYILIAGLACGMLSACNDSAFLREKPEDFLTVDNAFLNVRQFKTGINQMYAQVREIYNTNDGIDDWAMMGVGADVFMVARGDGSDLIFNDWKKVDANNGFSANWWNRCFGIIKNCNELLFQTENKNVSWANPEDKNKIQAEIRFFRAFAYRCLGHLFGGAPIVKDPVTTPKLDFVRSERIEVYKFCMEDLEFAAQYLPLTTTDPGRVVRAVADHLLTEIYLAAGDNGGGKEYFDKAIASSSRIISGTDGDYRLMTDRFGSRRGEADKNVYFDLFQMGNQNYQDGNKECLWAIQFEYNVTGGTNAFGRPLLERTFWPSFWQIKKFGYDGVARDWTGRGVAWIRPTNYSIYAIWKDAQTDIRNSEVNINRRFYAPKHLVNGVESDTDMTPYETRLDNGTTISLRPGDEIRKEWLTTREDTIQRYYPRFFKFGTDKHLDGKPDNGHVPDIYVFRLADTYLLRAEAYLKKGDKASATADINTIRSRSKAPLAIATKVDINYLLDERARELIGEEHRLMTLCRMNMLVERTRNFGWENSARTIQDYHNLFPIPQGAIDANLQAELKQNPGY